ncbi:MAG: exodeoxyribonuclease VII small subunit [Sterolibacteriaceae bacterium]|nr:exodeoxyribonuclease VII small subunit [Sterolibacteriaceae bacterium]MBK9085854.1 exodeoxyribonuclease VII small subunit [Sterolibacteriaceae bacterium]
MAKPPQSSPPVAESFESAMTELESIVQGMEAGRLSLEQSLAAYQRGAELLKFCQDTLSAAEQKVQVLESGVLREFERVGSNSGAQ